MEFKTSTKNKKLLIYDNFVYHFKYSGKVKETWICKFRRCPGKLMIHKTSEAKNLVKHIHNADMQEINNITANTEFKNLAINTTYSTREIYDKVALKKAAPINLNKKSVYKTINNLRKKSCFGESSNANFEIPLHLTLTYSREQFLFYESADMKIFTPFDNLLRLKKSATWIGEGTFLSSPIGFEQIYVIYGFVFQKIVPFVYVLMKNKTEILYNEALKFLSSKVDFYVPNEIILDNEVSAKVAFKKNFTE